MSGDADGFDKTVIGPFGRDDSAALEHLLRTLDRLEKEYPNGRGGSEKYEYDHVEGFSAWFDYIEDIDNLDEREEHSDLVALKFRRDSENLENVWPIDIFTYYQQSAQSHKVLFYGEDLAEYTVKVEILP